MDVRIVGVIGLVGALTACSAVPAAPDGSGAPVPVVGAFQVTSTVPGAPVPVETVPPLEAPIILTPDYDPTRIAALPPSERVVGVLDVSGLAGEPIQAPAEVRVGEPFTVTVVTSIPGCGTWGGDPITDTEVVMASNVVDLLT